MKTFVLIIFTIFLLIFHAPARAYYQWYDENGIVHYTQADPPEDAKDENGSSWWGTEPDKEEEKRLREQRLRQIRFKIKNRNARKPKSSIKPAKLIDEDVFVEAEEDPEQESEPVEKKGFFSRLFDFFSKKEECAEPWLLERYGICAFNKPDMEAVGNTFRAKVINNRKGVWSHCRGTYNGDILTFTFKGGTYWETDGNVPACPFYRGFYWNPPGR
jgi:hypothetical protein